MTDDSQTPPPPPPPPPGPPPGPGGPRARGRGPRPHNKPRGGRVRGRPAGGKLPSGVPSLEGRDEQEVEPNGEAFELGDLSSKSVDGLYDFLQAEGIEAPSNRMRKLDLVFLAAKNLAQRGAALHGEGCLEAAKDGHGFLRFAANSYCPEQGDIYVAPQLARSHGLQSGDMVSGRLIAPRDNDRFFGLRDVDGINGIPAGKVGRRTVFENLTPTFPDERFVLERDMRAEENATGRIIDIFAPIGKGQRGLLVSPPKSGKTVMLQHIAHAIEENHPEVELIVLLIDERPEEVTEMQRSVKGEVVASTFDEAAARHVHVAEMIIAKAKRRVEMGKDVVIMLDSITRLARAYNTVAPQTGRVLTGGVDSQALQRPKRFFGAARNIEHGGSLTIIATALVDTGSKMDEVIYEEFKGTGNMEIHLDRRISEKRIYPAISLKRCGTRREELLLDPKVLQHSWLLRRACAEQDDVKNAEWIIEQMRATKSNADMFTMMQKMMKK
ncbi:MAG: transcription termination factor Rho [Betaproteobacteria bacterium AqS2]|uniref:Transcription termination factor Rho n=1 Tax=Candidatus Amphirhobacter heronislandensis TaxID=1732024 RepID=A0A930UEW7_9GAMM|nr:transcription termination factor Rho [Betaproteobacteria bacterium AqS2]